MKGAVMLLGALVAFVGLWGCGGEKPAAEAGEGESAKKPVMQERDGMVLIPAGEFHLGCSPGYETGCAEHEKPGVRVYLDEFWIDKHPVTQSGYARVMGTNQSEFSDCGADCPVERVNWRDAAAFCDAAGKRLPTEAEWEKAARGGTETPYYWGEELDDAYAWHHGNAGGKTHPVGLRKPNDFGLHDMTGNVWEWVADCYDQAWLGKLEQGERNPANLCEGRSFRSIRGGSWQSDIPGILRISYRDAFGPIGVDPGIGFRCARDR